MKQDIEIAWDTKRAMPPEGGCRISADVIGSLAVHRTVGDEGWTVTHVPTGTALNYFRLTHRQAKRFRAGIQGMADWANVGAKGPYPFGKAVRQFESDILDEEAT